MLEALFRYVAGRLRRTRAVRFRWTLGPLNGCITDGEDIMYLLRDDQKLPLSIQPVDQYGNPARIDGAPTWSLSDDTLATLTIAADGLSAMFEPTGPLGVVQVNVSADADLGTGVRTISGVLDVQIEVGEAVSLSIVPGTPEPR